MGTTLADMDYESFARALYATNMISDPWLDGQQRFRTAPAFLTPDVYAALCATAEAIGRMYDELAEMVWGHPELLDEYFSLTPYQKLMWLASGRRWHGIARLDLFILADGRIQSCEMNSDTPSGEAEAVIVNRVLGPLHADAIDPNAGMEDRFTRMVLATHEAARGTTTAPPPISIGIIYPTDLPEDLSMIALYREWFERRGHTVTLGSPFNIHGLPDGRVALFDTPIDIMIRHYKTDWWGERVPAWIDEEEYEDPEPIDAPLRCVLDADARGRLTVVNPFGSVLTQNKLTMAFAWDHIDAFSPEAAATIREAIPETRRLRDVDADTIRKDDWVLKSDYGCEGDEVVIGRMVDEDIWCRSLEAARPERWVLQRFFEVRPLSDGTSPNYGVYLVGGEAAEIFTRLSPAATDYSAVVAPTYVRRQER